VRKQILKTDVKNILHDSFKDGIRRHEKQAENRQQGNGYDKTTKDCPGVTRPAAAMRLLPGDVRQHQGKESEERRRSRIRDLQRILHHTGHAHPVRLRAPRQQP
jgi:hypothetical protein